MLRPMRFSDRRTDECAGEDQTGTGRHQGSSCRHAAVPGRKRGTLGQPPDREEETAGGDLGDEVSTHFHFLSLSFLTSLSG